MLLLSKLIKPILCLFLQTYLRTSISKLLQNSGDMKPIYAKESETLTYVDNVTAGQTPD